MVEDSTSKTVLGSSELKGSLLGGKGKKTGRRKTGSKSKSKSRRSKLNKTSKYSKIRGGDWMRKLGKGLYGK